MFIKKKIGKIFFRNLESEKRSAIVFLGMGTFLEYFDLMLYIHMAVVLDTLFFPKTDPLISSLLAAFAFSSTYVFRPIGAFIFGYIGDKHGRKIVVLITTAMMAMSCAIMTFVPTYAQIGIAATWIVIGCRVVQGMSSMGEIMAASVFLTESIDPPEQYSAVASLVMASGFGAFIALLVAHCVTNYGFNWRWAFGIGCIVGIVGVKLRSTLQETKPFLENFYKKYDQDCPQLIKDSQKETVFNFALIECGYPLFFYLAYVYFNPVLKTFGYDSAAIITHNFMVASWSLLMDCVYTYLVSRFNPLNVCYAKGMVAISIIFSAPFLVEQASCPTQLLLFQFLIVSAPLGKFPANAVFISMFPVEKRVTITGVVYAITRALMFVTTSFGLVFLTQSFGHYGIWFIGLPSAFLFVHAINYFQTLFGKLEFMLGKEYKTQTKYEKRYGKRVVS